MQNKMKQNLQNLAKMMQGIMQNLKNVPANLHKTGQKPDFVYIAMKLFCNKLAFCDLFLHKTYCDVAKLLLE